MFETKKIFKATILLGVVAFLFSACVNDISEVEKLTKHEVLPEQTIINSTVVYSDSARVEFTIKAAQIDRFGGEEPYDVFEGGVVMTSFDEAGNLESEVSAEQAINQVQEKKIVAKTNVVLLNAEGKKLETEELIWDDNTKTVYTDKFVKITTPKEIIYGDGLEAEQDFSSYQIMNIKGRIKIEE